ncbi:MAG: tetratricopeptide repeat protein [Isosphaeraceae bacterium]|nr:tetratricopeptide repeat protein [Isosphaeraceae bacterium]
MRRRAVIAGTLAALLTPALSGCAAFRFHHERNESLPGQNSQCQQLSQSAQAAIDRRDYEAARGELQALVTQSPRSAEAYQRLGRVLQLEGRRAEAEAAYRHALALDPDYVAALTGLGEIEAETGRAVDALERFDAAIEIDPRDAEAHFAQGKVLDSLGRTDEALAAYFRALAVDPNAAAVLLRVAIIQLAHHQPDQALVRLDHVLELVPDDPEAHHQRGRAHVALNHPALALADLQIAAKHLPGRADVLYHLALAYQADHKPKPALDAAERALRIAPDYADARTLSAQLRR